MTGHDGRSIVSAPPTMMSTWTSWSDIMSGGPDLRKQMQIWPWDIMSILDPPVIRDHADLRKPATRPASVRSTDIMSNPPLPITARSGRRSP